MSSGMSGDHVQHGQRSRVCKRGKFFAYHIYERITRALHGAGGVCFLIVSGHPEDKYCFGIIYI
jgi:hypothetical protein